MKHTKILFCERKEDLQKEISDFVDNKITGKFEVHLSQDVFYYFACIIYDDEPKKDEKTTRYFKCEMTENQYKFFKQNNEIMIGNFKEFVTFEEINQTHIDKIAR